jgi:hypothetical protein
MTISTDHYTCQFGPTGVCVQFPQRPPPEAIQALKLRGFRWNPAGHYWWKRHAADTPAVLDALRAIFAPVPTPRGPCWICGAPGTFRNRGAATPVYCDACAAAHP